MPQYMLIFGKINCEVFDDPFIVGLYHGYFKSQTCGNEIMRPFVTEMLSLQQNDLVCGLNTYTIKLNAFVTCPYANSVITCVSLPNSLYGCSKCNQQGKLEFDKEYTSYPATSSLANLRNDEDFNYITQNEHHVATPILRELNIGLVSQFVLDYKIIICEGVMKHMMHLWTKDKLDYRINKDTLKKMSRDLLLLGMNCPKEFVKRPRHLDEMEDWDGNDWNEVIVILYLFIIYNLNIFLVSLVHFSHHFERKNYSKVLCSFSVLAP